MDKSKLRVVGLGLLLLVACSNVGFCAGGQRMKDGILLRSWGSLSLPAGDDESARVSEFIEENRPLLGLPVNSDVDLRLEKKINTAMGERYVFSQEAHGLPIFETQLILMISDDRIKSLFNSLSSQIFAESQPAISDDDALSLALDALDHADLRDEPQIELGWSLDGWLVYRLRLPGLNPPADWEVWVDARDGAILRLIDRRIFVDGSGRIFDPDPKTATENNSLTDQGDSNAAIPLEAYTITTLQDLNAPIGGYYYLDGPWVSTSPTANRAFASNPDSFRYWREDDRFEEVMVYYHIDREQRYFQNELQTDNANARQQLCNVNGTPEDQSWYSPFGRTITYGYGGVDDSEDADVILHEYGHAVQDDINRFWSGGHTGAMGEGYGDYLAGSYSLTVNPTFQPDWVFNWDGHNEFWAGRVLNAPYHYPENAGGEVHDSGQLWSAGLIDVWWDISDVVAWDRIVLQHHFLLGNGALMEDAAEAILVTELELYDGLYRQVIVDDFAARGFINPGNYYPTISHEPLSDTEDTLQTEFEVTAQITSDVPLDSSSLQLFWRADEDPFAPVALSPTGNLDEYAGIIPGPFNGQWISYYLTAADTLGMAAFLPDSAPGQSFQFYVGSDQVPPTVVWTDSLGETVYPTASFPVKTAVSDNIGIGSVQLRWKVGLGNWQSAPMIPVSADTFAGTLSYAGQTAGEVVQYFVRATDSSSQQNVADGTIHTFPIGTSAQLDDFEGALGPWVFTGNWGTTTQFARSGTYSIEDSPGQQYPPNSDTWAEWGEAWELTGFSRAYISFWEKHLLEDGSDWGRFEVSADNGLWQTLWEVTGSEMEWYLREVVLDDYCSGACDAVRFRFRTTTDDSGSLFGWYIDDVSITVEAIIHVQGNALPKPFPTEYVLGPVYPNPFNPTVNIRFALPEANAVKIKVFNVQGQMVSQLADTRFASGWHQVTFDGGNLPSGIYFCRLEAGHFVTMEKLVLLK